MATLRRAWLRLFNVVRPGRAEAELAREIDAHLALLTEHLQRQGLSPAAAAAEARRRFGSIAGTQELHRESRSVAWLDDLRRDVSYGARMLRRSPSFTAIAVLTLAVGIGLNTLVFTVTDAVVFQGFPLVERNDRLVYITSGIRCCLSYPDFEDWRAQATSFTDMALVHGVPATVTIGSGHPQLSNATEVTANTFRLVGQRPVIGRDFTDADMQPGASGVALLRYTAWQRWFGGDPAIVGRAIRVNGRTLTVIGVMPRGFSFPQNQDLWVPLAPTPDVRRRDARENWFALGRLSDGVTIARARAEMATIGHRLAVAYPATNEGANRTPRLYTFEDFFIGARAGALYRAMTAAVAFVLLIACANLANLLLARGVARAREMAVRMAIGAARARVIRQLLIENLMLSAMGGVVGWWVARAGLHIYAASANGSGVSDETFGFWFMDILDYSMDGRAFLYLAAISMLTTVVFGLLPALRLSRVDVGCGLKPGGRLVTADPRQRRASRLLVAAEMTLAIVLVAGAGTLLRGFISAYLASPGFDPTGVTVAQIALPRERPAADADLRVFLDRVLGGVGDMPSIDRVATASAVPGWNLPLRAFDVDGVLSNDRTRPATATVTIGGDYFRTLGLRLVDGRAWLGDDERSPLEAVVNEQFAKRYLAGGGLGRRIRFLDRNVAGPWLVVVGVAPDIAQNRSLDQREPVVYLPARQQPTRGMWVLAKSRSKSARVDDALRSTLLGLDPDLLLAYGPAPLADRLALNYEYRAIVAIVFALFAAIAVLLAAVGLYSVMAHAVAMRTLEIAIRSAMGGTVRQILRLVAADALRPVAGGVLGGLAASAALGVVLQAEFTQVNPSDPAMLAIACVILIIVAVIGCIVPARRAVRVDPMVATRQGE